VWAREARFDRFAHNDVVVTSTISKERKTGVKERMDEGFSGEVVKKVSWDKVVTGEQGEGEKKKAGNVVVGEVGEGEKKKRTVGEVASATV